MLIQPLFKQVRAISLQFPMQESHGICTTVQFWSYALESFLNGCLSVLRFREKTRVEISLLLRENLFLVERKQIILVG